jgi:hypothetical protein
MVRLEERGAATAKIIDLGLVLLVAAAVHFAGSKIRENRTLWQVQEKVTGCILVVLGLRLALEKRAQ